MKYLKEKFVTGFYNSATENAVYQFQRANFKWADGILGPETIELLLAKQKPGEKKIADKQKQLKGNVINMDITTQQFTSPVIGFLFSEQDNQVCFLNEQSEKNGLQLKDVAIGLRVYYDKSLKYQTISFSLEPADPCNPEGPYLEKVMYPDFNEKKKILCGTEFSELLFECDFLLKLMSIGVQSDSKTPFNYPEDLVNKGLKPAHKMKNKDFKENKNVRWSRYWVVCQEVQSVRKGNKVFIQDAKIGVDARQMTQDGQGKLIDKVIQDTQDECYMFAQQFTKIYGEVEKHYDCFKKLKNLYKSIALAKLIYLNKIPINLDMIKNIVQQTMVKNYQKNIPIIKYEETKTEEHKTEIPVDNRTMAIRALNNNKMEVNEKNIENAIQQITKNNNGKPFCDVQTTISKFSRFIKGGVDMNFQVKQKEENDNDSNSTVSNSTLASINEIPDQFENLQITKKAASPIIKQQKPQQQKEEFKGNQEKKNNQKQHVPFVPSQIVQVPFYFLKQDNCCVCGEMLSVLENSNEYDDKFYCSRHNPRCCFYCLQPIQQGCKIQGNKDMYDSPTFNDKELLFHNDCLQQFQNVTRYISVIEQQDEWVAKVNSNIINQLKSFDQKYEDPYNLHIAQQQKWTCKLCQSIHENNLLFCQRCNKIDENQVNIFLKGVNEQQKQNSNAQQQKTQTDSSNVAKTPIIKKK